MVPMKILIAEDEDTTRLVLRTYLQRFGHEVTEAADGAAALEEFRRVYFPVVISDWMMPNLTGPDLCRTMRSYTAEKYTYIVLLTSLGSKAQRIEGLDAGADDFMVKPFDPDELAARLRVAERTVRLHTRMTLLEGLLPICAWCKKIRAEGSTWVAVEAYMERRSELSFSHGICPVCAKRQEEELDRSE